MKGSKLLLALCLLAPFWLGPTIASAQEARTDHQTLSPYFVVEGADPSLDPLPLKDTRVELTVVGVIADVTVRQVYENRGSRPIHARYVFPASTRAAVYAMSMIIRDKRIVLRFRLSGEEVSSGLLLYQGPDENLFLLMAQPPEHVRVDEIPPREYVFVLDVSGSMNGFPLDTAKKLLTDLTGVLRPTDTFNIVLFADGSRTLAERSLPASPENLRRALRFIGPQGGGGGTELRAAMERAFAIPRLEGVSRSIVLITDGYIEAEKDVFDYVRTHLDRGNVFCFGIGSSVNRYLLEGVARAGQGEPFLVTKPAEAEAAAATFREYIESPVLTGIEVTFSGFDAYDVEPAKVPDLFARRPVVVFGKWRGRPQGTIELRGRTGQDPYRASFSPSEAPRPPDHRALRYLWARTRIANLSDLGGRGDETARAAVTQLGLTYNLLTQYTSFIAVEELIRNAGGEGRDVDQPLPLPVGVSDLGVGQAVTGGAEPELTYLAAALVLMLVGLRVLRSRRTGTAAS